MFLAKAAMPPTKGQRAWQVRMRLELELSSLVRLSCRDGEDFFECRGCGRLPEGLRFAILGSPGIGCLRKLLFP